jgi:MoxR-like ATPase
MEFYIHETKETIRARHRPIVIITSNAEKELPDAFLRRCIFHYIAFPDKATMRKIIKVHYKDVEEKLLNQVIETFYWLRDIKELQKKPSTSELLDWVRALQMSGVKVEKIHDDLPFLGVLLKKNQDIDVVWEIREKGYTRKGWGVLPG